MLSLISELAAKDITKMSKFGIKAEAEFDELKANENLNVDISSEVLGKLSLNLSKLYCICLIKLLS